MSVRNIKKSQLEDYFGNLKEQIINFSQQDFAGNSIGRFYGFTGAFEKLGTTPQEARARAQGDEVGGVGEEEAPGRADEGRVQRRVGGGVGHAAIIGRRAVAAPMCAQAKWSKLRAARGMSRPSASSQRRPGAAVMWPTRVTGVALRTEAASMRARASGGAVNSSS